MVDLSTVVYMWVFGRFAPKTAAKGPSVRGRGSLDGPDADGAGVSVLPLVEGPHVEPSFIVNSVVRRLTLMIG